MPPAALDLLSLLFPEETGLRQPGKQMQFNYSARPTTPNLKKNK